MKSEIFLNIALGAGCFCILWAAYDFRTTQEHEAMNVMEEKILLQRECQNMKQDLTFLETHQKEMKILHKKGWFSPLSRLIAGEFLQSLRSRFRKLSYQFEPEILKSIGDISFKVTQISIETESFFDLEVYGFIDTLSKKFPGILLPQEITLTHQKDNPTLITGKLVFDWVAMGERGE